MKKQEIEDFLQNLRENGITVEEYLEGMEALKELMERDVIYTGGFRMYGDATVAECYCSKCGCTFWVNYTAPRPYCVDCETCCPYDDHHLSFGVGRPNSAVEEAESRYHGKKIEELCNECGF